MAKKRPTQKAIAEVAKVSQGIVSQVLNGNTTVDVSSKTRDRIIRVAREMGYLPSHSGDHGYRRPSQKVWAYIRPFVTRDDHNEHWIYDSYAAFYDRIQAELVEDAFKLGYTLIVRPYAEPMELTHWLIESGASGVFWHARDEALLDWIVKRYPVVEINRRTLPNTDGISADQEAIISMGMQHLTDQGHRHIAYLPTNPFADKLWGLRMSAYRDYAKARGLTIYETFMTQDCDHQSFVEQFLSWDNPTPRPTALIANDHTALLIMKALKAAGHSIPEDLSILGIDNISACPFAEPALSSIDSPNKGIAKIATQMMSERMKDTELPFRKVAVTPQLIRRNSIASIPKTIATGQEPMPVF